MANRYGERSYRYGRETEANRGRSGREGYYGSSSERYRTGGSNVGRGGYGRDYEGYESDRDYTTRRYGGESSYGNYGYNAERDYDSGRESESSGYFTGSDYGRGATSGSSGYDRDYEYGRMSDYNRDYERGYGDRDYVRDYERDYSTRYGRGSEYNRNRYPSDYDYEERGFLDKASDEVASWFGDEDAAARRRMDAQMGEHRGRGPKGYKRSDERIKEDINDRLTYDSFIDASDIDVSVDNGEVVLSGIVTSRSAKRYAEDLAEQVSGVTNVENRLRVKQQDYGYTSGTTSAGTAEAPESQTITTGTSTTGTPLKTKTA